MYKILLGLTCMGLVLGAALTSVASAQEDPNLIGWWKLDETSGFTAYDSSGNGNDGTLKSDFNLGDKPQWTSGYAGGALYFDGADDLVEVPHSDTFYVNNEVTLMAWINTPRYTGSENSAWANYQAIITKGNDPRMYSLYTESGGSLHFSQGETLIGSVSADPIPLNEWVHVVGMVRDNAEHFYINGVPSDPTDGTGQNVVTPLAKGTEPLRIGSAPEFNSFYGKIDDVRIYDKAVSEEEILAIMVSGLSSKATLPLPDNGATDVELNKILTWKEGQYSTTRNVYFGTNFDDVNEASLDDPRGVLMEEDYDAITYDPGLLDYNQVYYWRVDEINAPEGFAYKGDVWSFTARNFIVVDDFERYKDTEPNRIFDTWMDGWDDAANGAQVGYFPINLDNDEHYVETSIVRPGGYQSMPVLYENNMTYSEAILPLSGLESDLTRDSVATLSLWFRGNYPYMGGYVENPAGTLTITGAGRDIWEPWDECQFVYKVIDLTSGSAKIEAKVDSIADPTDDQWAKAGVMIRDSLDPSAGYVSVLLTSGNGVRNQYRMVKYGETAREFDANVAAPYWVRVEMATAGLVRAYMSEDGQAWTRFTIRQVSREDRSQPMYVGLAVTSQESGTTAQAVFSHVTVTGPGSEGPWVNQDIGIVSSDAQPMYVALNGIPVYYQDADTAEVVPDATQIVSWTNWRIPLEDFSAQGADLAHVTSLALGIGDKDDAASNSGAGRVYFDDIRLYRP